MSSSLSINGVGIDGDPSGAVRSRSTDQQAAIQQFEAEIERLLQELEGQQAGAGGQPQGGPAAAPAADASAMPAGSAGASPSATAAAPAAGPSAAAAPSSTSAGSGPNAIEITNTTDKPMVVGKFENGGSTTAPSASLTLQPGQTGTMRYENGEAGFVAKADASGQFQPDASRLEYEADADGKMKYPDVSYIDGRNASISLTDGQGLNKGDTASIAAGAPADAVQTDAAGNKTITGYYDGSTAAMQDGANYMQAQLGTGGAYLHPNDDQLPSGQNPMSATTSSTIYASFGDA
jgi:hypothetical protein